MRKYKVEFEVFNRLLGKKEISYAIIELTRDIKLVPEIEVYDLLPSSVTKIISATEII